MRVRWLDRRWYDVILSVVECYGRCRRSILRQPKIAPYPWSTNQVPLLSHVIPIPFVFSPRRSGSTRLLCDAPHPITSVESGALAMIQFVRDSVISVGTSLSAEIAWCLSLHGQLAFACVQATRHLFCSLDCCRGVVNNRLRSGCVGC
jgi:hypothetical protein